MKCKFCQKEQEFDVCENCSTSGFRYNTKVSWFEDKYNVTLDVNGDKKIGNFLKEKGYYSLSKMFNI
jgi:hypothetical protein